MSKKLLSLLFTCLIGVSAVSCSSPVTRKQIVPEARAVKHYTGFFAALKDDCSESERIRSIIADKTGAVCEEKWLTKNDNRDDVISIMINKGDYPDFIYAGTDHSKFLEAKAYIPLENYIEKKNFQIIKFYLLVYLGQKVRKLNNYWDEFPGRAPAHGLFGQGIL